MKGEVHPQGATFDVTGRLHAVIKGLVGVGGRLNVPGSTFNEDFILDGQLEKRKAFAITFTQVSKTQQSARSV